MPAAWDTGARWTLLWLSFWVGAWLAPPPAPRWPAPQGWAWAWPAAGEAWPLALAVAAGLVWMQLAGAWPRWPWRAVLAVGLAGVVAGGAWAWAWRPLEGPSDLAGVSPRRWLRLEAVLVRPPRRDAEGRWRAIATVQACPRFPGRGGRFELVWPEGQAQRPREGGAWRVAGAWRRPSAPWNPLAPRPGAQLARQGAFAQLWAEEAVALGPAPGWRAAWAWRVDGWRVALAEGMGRGLRPEQAGLLASLTLGEAASELPKGVSEAFRAVGLSHLVAASGAQVALVGGVAWWLARRLWLRAGAAWAAAVAVGAYLALTGGPPSMVRAALMGWIAIVAWGRGEAVAPRAALAIAGLGALVWCPAWASDWGYLLSVLATAGLLRLASWPAPSGCPEGLWAWLWVPWWCWLWTGPTQAWAFGQASCLALVANWLAAPVGLVAAPWGLALGGVGWAWPGAAGALNRATGLALDLLVAAVASLAAWPGQALALAAWPVASWVALQLALLAGGRRPWLAGMALAVGLLSWASHRPGGAGARLWVLDVGQGLSVVVRSPQGEFAVLDGGPVGMGSRVLLPFLQRLGCRRLALLVATHAHADHVGGLSELAQALPVAQAWEAGQASEEASQAALLAALVGQGCGWRTPEAGRCFSLGPWRLESLGPGPGPETNEGSLGLRLSAEGCRVLVPGDGEAKAEAAWGQRPQALGAELLVLGHHGSRTSSSEAFLAAVRPRLAIASAGRGNGFGHPHPSTLARLTRLGIPLLRTDQGGAVALRAQAGCWRWGQGPEGWALAHRLASR